MHVFLYIVIPAWNEQKLLPESFAAIRATDRGLQCPPSNSLLGVRLPMPYFTLDK